jgi:hypothetical protein
MAHTFGSFQAVEVGHNTLTKTRQRTNFGCMKVKTSINGEGDLLETIDRLSGKNKTRSEFIEAAIQVFVAQRTHEADDARDLEMINKSAEILNQEALDVLDYQVAV